jgi:acetyltransferase-like isoleucine patch superfamily enzyme
MKQSRLILHIKAILIPIYQIFSKKINGKNNTFIKNSFPRKLNLQIRGNNNQVEFQSNCFLDNISVFIYGNNNKIIISESCTVKSGVFWIEDNNCEIFIDNKTTIESVDFGVSENNSKIFIGKDCMISSGVKFKTGDSHSIIDTEKNIRINPAGNITIGNHVWIGQEVILLKNTTIGDNSIVGIRSLVTKNFENNVLIAGIPAKIIKEKINWTRERI